MFFSNNDDTFITEVQEILPVSVAITRLKIWPYLEQTERKFILPLLERHLFDDLDKYYNHKDQWTSGSGDDDIRTAELLRLIQIAEINLAYFIGFDLLSVTISDAGFQVPADGQSFKGLYKYKEDNIRKSFETAGYNGLDDVLKYIEDYIEHFPEWEESANFTIRKKAIIKDAETFDLICFINKSRLTFLRLQRYMNEIIDFDIKPLLGTEWTTLQEELAKEDPAAKYLTLVPEIQKPLAFLSCARLIEKTGALTDRGLFFEGSNSMSPDGSYKRPAEGDSIVVQASSYKNTGTKYLEALRQYLIANSFTQQGSVDGSVYNRDNDLKKTFVA
jgi:hypothetical protein